MNASLPGAPWLARQGQDLVLDGCSLGELGQLFGTPLYVYSRNAMKAALSSYQRALAGRPHLVCYAMKANSTAELRASGLRLRHRVRRGIGACDRRGR
jgi:diaminopimelate decarboxylase